MRLLRAVHPPSASVRSRALLVVATLVMALPALAGCLLPDAAGAGTVNVAAGTVNVAAGTAGADAHALPVDTEDGVSFLVIGDSGTGAAGQYAVARAMERVCAERGCDLVLGTGDNVYPSGVSSPFDPQFETKFEQPYADLAVPFLMTLGNHDNGEPEYDGGFGSDSRRGDHQVAYHYRDNRSSEKWHMPARYYDYRVGDVHFVALDTNTMMWMGDPFFQRDVLVLEQRAWFQDVTAESDATWTFTIAHHPYVSNGEHGNAGEYERMPGLGVLVKQFFEEDACDVVDVHFAGHDHDLQWLKPAPACPDTEFIVSGAAAKTRPLDDPERNPAWFQRGSTPGFWWVHVDGDAFTGIVYDAHGTPLYERSFTKSRDA